MKKIKLALILIMGLVGLTFGQQIIDNPTTEGTISWKVSFHGETGIEYGECYGNPCQFPTNVHTPPPQAYECQGLWNVSWIGTSSGDCQINRTVHVYLMAKEVNSYNSWISLGDFYPGDNCPANCDGCRDNEPFGTLTWPCL